MVDDALKGRRRRVRKDGAEDMETVTAARAKTSALASRASLAVESCRWRGRRLRPRVLVAGFGGADGDLVDDDSLDAVVRIAVFQVD
jgi:hypothetical protein